MTPNSLLHNLLAAGDLPSGSEEEVTRQRQDLLPHQRYRILAP